MLQINGKDSLSANQHWLRSILLPASATFVITAFISVFLLLQIAQNKENKRIFLIGRILSQLVSEPLKLREDFDIYKRVSTIAQNDSLEIIIADSNDRIILKNPVNLDDVNYKDWNATAINNNQEEIGTIYIRPAASDKDPKIIYLTLSISLIGLFGLLIYLLYNSKKLYNDITKLVIHKLNNNYQSHTSFSKFETMKVRELEQINQLIDKFTESQFELRKATLLAHFSAQVAHDIRSPLAALNVIETKIREIDSSTYELFRNSLIRIKEITNDLLKKNIETIPIGQINYFNVKRIIELIINEKKQFLKTTEIDFLLKLDLVEDSVVIQIKEIEFKRILSNLLDNSIDAISNKLGLIEISVHLDDSYVVVTIKDNGQGIKQELIPNLFKRGATFGKLNGTGLGLFHAKTCLEGNRGMLRINSVEGVGTQVVMYFMTL